MEEETIYTSKEAAKLLGISPSAIYRMEKHGIISSIKALGRKKGFKKTSIENYLKKSRNFANAKSNSKHKKANLTVKEVETAYIIENIKTDELLFHKNSIWIYNADILKTNSINKNSIDLIATSPPYNVDIKYNSHNDTMSYDDYLLFTREWFARCYEFIKEDGRFCLNIPLDKNKGGQQSMCADITTIAKQVGFKYHSTIIWNEQNISRRTAWGSWLSASAPYVIAPVEVIVVLYKKEWKKTWLI